MHAERVLQSGARFQRRNSTSSQSRYILLYSLAERTVYIGYNILARILSATAFPRACALSSAIYIHRRLVFLFSRVHRSIIVILFTYLSLFLTVVRDTLFQTESVQIAGLIIYNNTRQKSRENE